MGDSREAENKQFLEMLREKLSASRQGLSLQGLTGRDGPKTDTGSRDKPQNEE